MRNENSEFMRSEVKRKIENSEPAKSKSNCLFAELEGVRVIISLYGLSIFIGSGGNSRARRAFTLSKCH